jgi:hypothetical protein
LKDIASDIFADPETIALAGETLKVNAVTFPVREDSHKKITAFESAGTATVGTRDEPSAGSPLSCPLTFLPQQDVTPSVL